MRLREQELAERELALLEKELHILFYQQQQIQAVPVPKKRRGKFRKHKLKLLKKEPGQKISKPSGKQTERLEVAK